MKQLAFALALLALTAASDSNHRVARTRLLYVTDASGLSVYDIDRGHAFVRKIPIANSGAYKGIGASPPLGFLFPDGGVVIDTRTKKVVARIPTSEKLIEVDFEGGKVVAAGHR